MEVNHIVSLRLTSPTVVTVDAVQGDGARLIVASLLEGTEPWEVPEGTSIGIGYTLPDKTEGYYDRLEDGSPAAMIAGNLVTAALAPVLTAQAGTVKLSLILRQGERQIATFPLQVRVQKAVGQVTGEDVMPPKDGFDGKLYYGGPGGTLIPLGIGSGVRVDTLADGTMALVSEGDGGGAGQNATLYIGSDEPTGENRPLYWLDTSGDAPVVPDEPEEPEEPEAVTLVGIAASYTGGDVAVGTALDALTGITVTASYSDGSTAAVTGYTLSGTIGEGSNTVTVTYQGKTATFTVAGVAQGGELPGIHEFVLNVPYLGSKASVLGEDVSGQNNPAIVAAGNPAANLPITDYLNSDYAELYAISYRPNAGDVYGGPMGWRAYRYGHLGDGVPVWQEETQIAEVSVSSTSGVDSSKLKIHKLVRADILAALNDGYSESDIRAIVQHIPNVGSKNYNVSVVWMATMPTEEQQQAIISYFEQGGEA